jgi:hypothetical protein
MSNTLVTFPGRAGDLLWALPTVRAISESLGSPVDLQIAGEFESLLELLRLQPYLGHVCANPHWGMDSWLAPVVVGRDTPYDQVIDLGYRRWPELALPFETQYTAQSCYGLEAAVDLERPWITVADSFDVGRLVSGWSDCHFELKVGLHSLISNSVRIPTVLAAPGSRWVTERWGEGERASTYTWEEAASALTAADVFLGDCSALHVLAVALGKPCVLVEPMEARWNPIFYPLGMDGRVKVVKGLDGKPTFDARHTADVLREVLR